MSEYVVTIQPGPDGLKVTFNDPCASLQQENQTLRSALAWYAGHHRPEDYLNDNGERARAALQGREDGPT